MSIPGVTTAKSGKKTKSLTNFALMVRAAALGYRDIRAAATEYASEYSAQSGGFAVPEDFIDTIYMRQETALLPYCDTIPVTSNHVGVPVDGTAPWEASAIKSAWIEEGTPPDEQRPNLSLVGYRPKKMITLVPVTEELAEDSPALNAWLPNAMGRAATWTINDAIINGLGAGRPLGILNSDALITVAKDANQPAVTITAANVATMMARCLDLEGARWIANPDAIEQIVTLTGLWDSGTRTLGGLPITLTEACQALGNKGDLILANLSGYRVANRGQALAESSHLYFDQGMKVFRLTTRLDGSPILAAPTTPPHSIKTRSHFVTLEERA